LKGGHTQNKPAATAAAGSPIVLRPTRQISMVATAERRIGTMRNASRLVPKIQKPGTASQTSCVPP